MIGFFCQSSLFLVSSSKKTPHTIHTSKQKHRRETDDDDTITRKRFKYWQKLVCNFFLFYIFVFMFFIFCGIFLLLPFFRRRPDDNLADTPKKTTQKLRNFWMEFFLFFLCDFFYFLFLCNLVFWGNFVAYHFFLLEILQN